MLGVSSLIFEVFFFLRIIALMAAATDGLMGRNGSSWIQVKEKNSSKKRNPSNRVGVCRAAYSSVMDPYKTLRIEPGASESEVKKAFRQLALQVRYLIFFFLL